VSEAEVVALTSEVRTPPSPWFVRLTTFGLMAYLQNSIGKQLKWLYPTNPQAADKWLEQEIYRWAGLWCGGGDRAGVVGSEICLGAWCCGNAWDAGSAGEEVARLV
jgi:hypothetical protein